MYSSYWAKKFNTKHDGVLITESKVIVNLLGPTDICVKNHGYMEYAFFYFEIATI